MILSIVAIVSAGVGCTNVVCPHNGTYDFCVLQFFRKQVSGHSPCAV